MLMVPLCFILVTASNMDDSYSKMVIPTNRIISIVAGKKQTSVKLIGTQYDGYFDIKETPEEVLTLIKKECK
jgi:hypothetical protein